MRPLIAFGFIVLLASAGVAAPPAYLLISESELAEARRKADEHPRARQVLDDLLERAEEALGRPVELPARGGQWPHWYSCKRDGARLKTISPTEHRCPVCGTVYRGEPYDSVPLYHQHGQYSRAVRDLGLAYRLTGRAELARRAKEILLGYAARYRNYPLHDRFGEAKTGGGHVMAQTLDESVWLIPVVWGYSLVRETLSEEERRRVEEGLLRPAAGVIREHKLGIHNIQCWKNSAVGLVGFAVGDEELIREAIDDPQRGFRAQMARGVTSDGLWFEGSLGYHHYTMSALWPLAEAARLAEIDLYSDRYRALFDAPISLALPNGDSPGFNDNAGGNLSGYAPLYELAYARWGESRHGKVAAGGSRNSLEALLYGAARLPEGSVAPEASILLRDAGYAALRSPLVTAAVRFGMHGGGHGHPDKLNVVTYGAGRLAGLDPGSINYGVPLHQEWYKSTIAHNTVSVDGQIQKNEDGQLEEWRSEGGVTKFTGVADRVYDGVVLRRTLELDGAELRDRFECSSDGEHTYDWAFHAPGRISSSLALEAVAVPLGETNGYQHISSVRRAETGEDWWAEFDLGGAKLRLRVKGEPDTEVFTGEGPGRDPNDLVPVLIIRRKAARTVFEVTHRFER